MSKYHRQIGTSKTKIQVDVYDVLAAFNVTCPARQHAIKKLLCAGQRGSKTELQDLHEAGQSIVRAVEIAESYNPATVPCSIHCENNDLRKRIEELESLFELRHKADMRGISMWRAENPEERNLTQPDHGEMVTWLLSQLQEAVGMLERISSIDQPSLYRDTEAFIARIRAGSDSKAT